MKCLNPHCDGYMILVLKQVRNNPITGQPIIEETWHCPKCLFVFMRAVPKGKAEGYFKLTAREALKKLGYL